MKVLHLRQSSAMYGPEQTILGFCRALPEFGFDCTIGLIHRPLTDHSLTPPMRAEAGATGIPFVQWPGAPLRSFHLIRQIREYLNAQPVDLIHSHDYKANWAALLAVRGAQSRPTLITTPRHSEQHSLLRLLQGVDAKLLHHFDRIVEASPSACERLQLNPAIAGRVRLVRHGVEAMERGQVENLPDSQGHPVVLLAGRLEEVKGHKLFLRAMKIVAERQSSARIWFAGEGSMRDELTGYARSLGLLDRLSFLGYREDIGNVFRKATVAVVASSFETSCRVAMEALAFGCPLVATPVGIIPELSEGGETIALTPHGDAAQMGETILRILNDPAAAQRMRERGEACVRASAGHREAASELASIYREALSSR